MSATTYCSEADVTDNWVRPRWACCGGFCDVSHTASCPVQSRNAPAIEAMLLGIRRVLDTWPAQWEHRCWTPMGVASSECTCGRPSAIVGPPSFQYMLNLRWAQLFRHAGFEAGRRGIWTARPGTTLERTV